MLRITSISSVVTIIVTADLITAFHIHNMMAKLHCFPYRILCCTSVMVSKHSYCRVMLSYKH